MKKLLLIPLFGVLVAVFLIVWFYKNVQPVSSNKTFGNVIISKGASASQIADKLQSSGFIKSNLAFKIYVKATGQASKLQAGEFRLSPSYTLFQTINALFSGPIELWVTIPEGLRREEVAQKFAVGLDKDQTFVTDFLAASKGKEGYLFPDTYLFPKEATPGAIVNRMVSTFEAKTTDLPSSSSSLTKPELVTLASLIERETKTDAERPIVAGIMINRLEAGMPLQIDASVQYAVGSSKDWWPILSRENLSITSPYNTYKFAGLPPAPIASPGISSIKAAFTPQTSDYWYYIHDPSGQIHYAKTLIEHNANVRKYLGK